MATHYKAGIVLGLIGAALWSYGPSDILRVIVAVVVWGAVALLAFAVLAVIGLIGGGGSTSRHEARAMRQRREMTRELRTMNREMKYRRKHPEKPQMYFTKY